MSIKQLVINGMVGLSAMLLIIAFFVGDKQSEKAKSHTEVNQEQTEDLQADHSYSDNHGSHDSTDSSTITDEHEHVHEEYEYENPEVDQEENPPKQKTLADYFPKEDLDASKKVAESFIKNYYPFDGDNPVKHIENSKQYMSDELAKKIPTTNIRSTQTIHKKELVSLEVYEPYNISDEVITWNVRVKGKVFDRNGKQTQEETYDYALEMVKTENGFKVDNFTLNTGH